MNPIRLDVYVADTTGISRSYAQQCIENGFVTVNGLPKTKKYAVMPNDEVECDIPPLEEIEAKPQNIPIEIIYEDDNLLIVNKPQGMVVHPAAGNADGTLVNALLYHCGDSLSGINGKIRPGIVHRIDKDTAGLLIVAKNDESHKILAEQIAVHSFTRRYEAIVNGNLKDDAGTIDLPIGRHKTDRKKMAVTAEHSRNAITHYKVLERFKGFTYTELTLETGRTHQIRVHMSHIGHPVAGDPVYGDKTNRLGLNGQCLFAKYIKFIHPITKKEMEFSAELPEFFKKALECCRIKYKL